jgi:uncharacterized membrane protein
MKNITLFILFGVFYACVEVIFTALTGHSFALKGTSSVWMFLVGGLDGLMIGLWNGPESWKTNWYRLSVLRGAAFITITEFLSGMILNRWFGMNIWDYSQNPINLLGQVDIIHCTCWLLIVPLIIWLDDAMRHYIYGEDKPGHFLTYYKKLV